MGTNFSSIATTTGNLARGKGLGTGNCRRSILARFAGNPTPYRGKVSRVESGWHPETVRIGAWAKITDIFMVSYQPSILALLPYAIWNEKFVTDRLKWKPSQPMYILLLRVYKLTRSQLIPYRPEYGGCKSWIDLSEPISTEGSLPVLIKQTNGIRGAIANPMPQ